MALSGSPFLGLSGKGIERQNQLEESLKVKQRLLLVLQKQVAVYASDPPPHITHEIKELEDEIASLKEKLDR